MAYHESSVPVRYQNAVLVLLILLLAVATFITGWLGISYHRRTHELNAVFEQQVTHEMHTLQMAMQTIIATLVEQGLTTMQQAINQPDAHVISLFDNMLSQNPQLYAMGIAYEPFAFTSKTSLHSILCFKQQGAIKHIALDTFYDYTKQEWFNHELPAQGAWLSPFHDSVTGTTHIRYAIPFFAYDTKEQQRVRKGIFFIDVNGTGIKDIMENLELKDAQYAFLMAQNGLLLYFPGTSEQTSLESQLQESNPAQYELMLAIAQEASRHKGGSATFHDPLSAHEYQLFYEPIKEDAWVLGLVFERTRTLQDVMYVRRQEIAIGLAGSIVLWLLICLLSGAYYITIPRLWIASVAGALLIFLCVGFIILLDREDIYQLRQDRRVIINTLADLQRFMLLQAKEKSNHLETIPTGIFINSLGADASDNITARGIIWQRYTTQPTTSDKGVYIDYPDETKMHTAYAATNTNAEKDGWHFKTTKNPHFNYAKYPFDKQEVSIAIHPKNLISSQLLTPDFDAYEFTGRTAQLGLGRTVRLDGWIIYQSYFNYMVTRYPTTFGIVEEKKSTPELQFTIRLERDFINPLIAGFLPIAIVWFLVFAVLFITTDPHAPVSHVLSFVGTLFFSVLLAHLRLKTVVPGVVISYMEYVYFLTYVIIFIASVNSLAYKLQEYAPLLHLHNNIITKLLYWPGAALCLLGITLLIFYS